MSASRSALRTGLTALTIGGALFAGATPAHALAGPPAAATADAQVLCLADVGTPGWHFTLTNGASSPIPVDYLVVVDGVPVFGDSLPIGSSKIDDAAFPNATTSNIKIFAENEIIYEENGSGDCSTPPPPPPTGTVSFACAEDGGYLSYGFVTGEPGNTLYDVVLPDGSNDQWAFPAGTFGVNLEVTEDAPYDVSISLNGVELSEASGVADCLPPVPTADPPPPTTDPSSDPTPTVLSSGEEAHPASEDTGAPEAAAAELPRTGTASGPLAAAGTTFVLAGASFLALARRRRHQV